MRGWGYCPQFICQSYMYLQVMFCIRQLNGSLQARDQDSEWEGELSDASGSCRSLALWGGMSTWPSIWRLTLDISSTMSLNLAAMDMKLVAVN